MFLNWRNGKDIADISEGGQFRFKITIKRWLFILFRVSYLNSHDLFYTLILSNFTVKYYNNIILAKFEDLKSFALSAENLLLKIMS